MKINKIKKLLVHCRTSIKLICLIAISAFLILGAVILIYKPIYSVSLNGEFVGYSKDKRELQKKINDYMEKGEGPNIAFVQIDTLPEYKMCMLKKGIVTNDDEIFQKVKQTGTNYYTYYAIVNDGEEKFSIDPETMTYDKPGWYNIIYTAKDAKGNVAKKVGRLVYVVEPTE